MSPTVFVSDSASKVGSSLVSQLLKKNARVLAGVTGSSRAPSGADEVSFDLTDSATYSQAVRGADVAVVIPPLGTDDIDQQLRAFLDECGNAKVAHVVYVSFRGADAQSRYPSLRRHGVAEGVVESANIAYTIVRPANLYQDFTAVNSWSLQGQGAFFCAWGTEAVSFVDARDVAAVVTAIAVGSPADHDRRVYTLTSGSACTGSELAQTLSSSLNSGRQYRYQAINDTAARHGMTGAGLAPSVVAEIESQNQAVRGGCGSEVTGDVRLVSGHEPLTWAQYAEDYPDQF